MLRKAIEYYARLLRWLLALAVGILIFPVSMQIFSRYTELIPSYIWTEEMARFLCSREESALRFGLRLPSMASTCAAASGGPLP